MPFLNVRWQCGDVYDDGPDADAFVYDFRFAIVDCNIFTIAFFTSYPECRKHMWHGTVCRQRFVLFFIYIDENWNKIDRNRHTTGINVTAAV